MKPEKFLREFFRAWESTNGYRDALPQFLTQDCDFEIVGLSNTVGPEETVTFMDQLEQKTGIASRIVEFTHVTASKNQIFLERLDNLFDGQGRRLGSVRVMSVVDVTGKKVSAWRDYLDTTVLRPNPN